MYALGVDFGGGASKATLIDEAGRTVATASAEYPTHYGEGGAAEQNPADWYAAACRNIRAAIRGIDPAEIACLCFDAATHTAVLMDADFRPVRRAVYWTDTRCVAEKKFLAENFGAEIFGKCLHEVDTVWTLPEILFVKNRFPEDFGKVRKICFAKDYVRRLFTGDFVTDRIEAEGSMFFDFAARKWDRRLLSVAGLDESFVPEVREPLDVVGVVAARAAADSGLRAGTKVVCGSTDTVMEVFVAGGSRVGDVTLKLATAGRICAISDRPVPDKNIVNYSHLIGGLYYPGSATKSCAASLRWFRDAFGGDYAEFDRMAAGVPVGADGLLFHPYLTGEMTPYADPLIRGGFTGLSATHTKAHFARAVLEGVAMSLRDCREYLAARGLAAGGTAVAIGGGAKSTLWRQIVADALNIRLTLPAHGDSSYGSAMCAGVAAGFFPSLEAAAALCREEAGPATEPVAGNAARYDEIFPRYKRIADFFEAEAANAG